MKCQDCTKWILKFSYITVTAFIWVKPKATLLDLMMFGCVTAFMLITSYGIGVLFELGVNDAKKILNNKKENNETKSN